MDKFSRNGHLSSSSTTLQLVVLAIVLSLLTGSSLASPWDAPLHHDDPDSSAAVSDKLAQQLQGDPALAALNSYPLNLDQSAYLDKLAKFISSKRRLGGHWAPFSEQIDGVQKLAAQKRQQQQIRYHQCYFNPISCFRKRK